MTWKYIVGACTYDLIWGLATSRIHDLYISACIVYILIMYFMDSNKVISFFQKMTGKVLEDDQPLSSYDISESKYIVIMVTKPKPLPAVKPKPLPAVKAKTPANVSIFLQFRFHEVEIYNKMCAYFGPVLDSDMQTPNPLDNV